MKNFKLICWDCGKEFEDIPMGWPSNWPYRCECGGFVVSPSGKVQGKWVDESAAYGNDCRDGKCEM